MKGYLHLYSVIYITTLLIQFSKQGINRWTMITHGEQKLRLQQQKIFRLMKIQFAKQVVYHNIA